MDNLIIFILVANFVKSAIFMKPFVHISTDKFMVLKNITSKKISLFENIKTGNLCTKLNLKF